MKTVALMNMMLMLGAGSLLQSVLYELSFGNYTIIAPEGNAASLAKIVAVTNDATLPTPPPPPSGNRTGLDFAVVGFEKTGTTFLLKALGDHPEIIMPAKHSELSKRVCSRKDSGKTKLLSWL
eukprot:CAMPEP_0172308972 /NCGR_PEP_ID=MMETSP1058-20130122/9409_1 /TAXON_ID=83371 /ORGANISM="Detonula confervacea, Strain CCMP 353" /LENGTH=122 /DNA_ID=CAMNT_0013021511 /DNA_START=27 /DNA_END=392 /DNA_ORIENTATION=+